MKYVTTIIIGAGQAGLAMSNHLSNKSIDHVVLERGKVANSWKTERWDSLRLLTPNWQSRLPDYSYQGNAPDSFMAMPELTEFLDTYAKRIAAPIHEETSVISVTKRFERFVVKTNRGTWVSNKLVIATGACNLPNVPTLANELPNSVTQISPINYKSPDKLPPGNVLVVGASATGVQLARELQESGRQVFLSVGEHIRVPRIYRGYDIQTWLEQLGFLDTSYLEVDDLSRVRNLASLQLVGNDEGTMIDLNALSALGVEITGRMVGSRDGCLQFSGSLGNMCNLADLKMNRLLESIDLQIKEKPYLYFSGDPIRFDPTLAGIVPRLTMKTGKDNIKTIIWATGYRPNYSWLTIPVLNRKGELIHDGGISPTSGLYALGLPFMRKRKSTLIDGVGDDAAFLADHLVSGLNNAAA